jgi:hypothetical protein
MKTYLVTLLAVSAAFAPGRLSAQVNLVQNGSFEVNYSFSDWTLSYGSLVNLGGLGSGVQCADGYNAVGLGWQSTLYQDVPTVVGQQYDFSFYMADWYTDFVHANVVSLNPSFGSTSLGTVSFSGAGKTYQNMGWEEFDYTVTATSTSTQITFYNPGVYPSDTRWPMIDDVWLTTVPEPSVSMLLFLSGAVVLSRCRRTSRMQRTP